MVVTYCTDANLQDSNTAVHPGFLWILTLCLPLTWSHYFDRDYVYYRPWVHWHMVSHSGNGLLRLSGQLAVRISVLVVWLVIVMMRGSCDNHTHTTQPSHRHPRTCTCSRQAGHPTLQCSVIRCGNDGSRQPVVGSLRGWLVSECEAECHVMCLWYRAAVCTHWLLG